MMARNARVLGLLGLATRAGQVVSGGDMVEREIRAGRAALAFMDEAVSDRTRDRMTTLCQGRGIPLYELSADTLGRSIGKDNRMVAIVREGSLAKQLATLLHDAANP